MRDERSHPVPPFGTYAPTGASARLIGLVRAVPWRWPARRLAALARHWLGAGATDRLIDIDVHAARMRLAVHGNACDRNALLLPRFQDPVVRQALEQRVGPGFVFVDIGANVGLFSVFVAARNQPGGRVLSIEPQPDIFARLRANMDINGFRHVDLVHGAVSDTKGELDLHLSATNSGEASLKAGLPGDSGRVVRVAVHPLIDLVTAAGLSRIDGLKIDVEGLEDRILGPFFDAAPPALWPRLVIIEYSPQVWSADIVARMQGLGYRILDRTTPNWLLERDPG